jgi:hypothetical protein
MAGGKGFLNNYLLLKNNGGRMVKILEAGLGRMPWNKKSNN